MLILLDIDGVMVPASIWKKPEFLNDGFPIFSNRAVRALQKIISETDANILLTTSHKSKYNDRQWREIFQSRGINANRIDQLPDNYSMLNRKDEILSWRRANQNSAESFVVIDDDKLLNDLPPDIKANLVLTSPSVGLTDDLANEAIAILNNRSLSFS
jgi:hypothetical protein